MHKNTLHYFALDMPGMAFADFGSAVPPISVFGAPIIFETLSFMVSTESFATPQVDLERKCKQKIKDEFQFSKTHRSQS